MKLNLDIIVQEVFDGLEENNFGVLGRPQDPIWQRPLIGVAAGDDSYYDYLKEHIGSFHWSPAEVFGLKYQEPVEPRDLRVISIAFPQTEKTKAYQREAVDFPCDNWVISRGEWEPMMKVFSGRLVEAFAKIGIPSVSIDLQPEFRREISESLGIASLWSHRHTAYAAGLGTFGLSDGLITEKGKAVRLTSLIVKAPLEITPRTYKSPYEWCLFYQDGSCGTCISRCPAGALSQKGHNKSLCGDYEDFLEREHWPAHIEKGNYIFGCGICQAKVPCESRRP